MWSDHPGGSTGGPSRAPRSPRPAERAVPPQDAAASPTCLRCGFEVTSRALGCKNPCPNCGTVYPLGDCSD